MNYISVKQASDKWSVSPDTVRTWCKQGLITGAIREERSYNPGWLIPNTSERPLMGPITHCKRGHPLSGTNLWVSPNGKRRMCRACNQYREGRRKAVDPSQADPR